jgi:hypothetical protein
VAAAQAGERPRHEHCARAGERTEANPSALGRSSAELAGCGVEFVEGGGGVSQQHAAGSRELDAARPALEQLRPGLRLQSRDLPGHRGLRVAERCCRTGERAALRDLAQDTESSHRRVHDNYAYHACLTCAGRMPFLCLASVA